MQFIISLLHDTKIFVLIMLRNILHLLVLLILVFIVRHLQSLSIQPLVLLLSFDGIRYDFISKQNTPTIWRLAEDGVFATNGLKTQVATVTAANHHCIATGLYQESHGIIDNTFYDPIFEEHYDIWNLGGDRSVYENSKRSKWYSGEPIWITNTKAIGHQSGTYNWPMGDVEVNGTKPKHSYKTWIRSNANLKAWKEEIDELLTWFTRNDDPINLGMYYNDEPDMTEHSFDIFGLETRRMLKQVDDLIEYLIQVLQRKNMLDKVNLILTSDHGFASVPDTKHSISYWPYLNMKRVVQSSYSFFAIVDKSTVNEIYANLTKAKVDGGLKIKVWRKEDFPDKYHWKNNRRVGPVIVFNEIGYEIGSFSRNTPHGTHFGYLNDEKEMNVFFVAHGPAFKKGYKFESSVAENVDLYSLICDILKIEPSTNNGSLARISAILNEHRRQVSPQLQTEGTVSSEYGSLSKVGSMFGVSLLVLILLAFGLYRFNRPVSARRRLRNRDSFLER